MVGQLANNPNVNSSETMSFARHTNATSQLPYLRKGENSAANFQRALYDVPFPTKKEIKKAKTASKFSKTTPADEKSTTPEKQETFEIYLERPPEHLIVEEDRKPTATKKRGCAAGSTDPKKKTCMQTRQSRNQVATRRSQRMIAKEEI